MTDWLTAPDALAQVKVQAESPDAALVERVRKAVVAKVEEARPDLIVDDVFTPTDDVLLGALMLVGRLWARRNSPTGLASYGDFGPAAILRFDPDIEKLLGMGRYGRPVVG